ncbi:MAG: helix-turn-helix transcriptional regulator [bacterium]|nr:helix-turn-helix transcriptional regulator [bacterium]
MTFAVKAHHEAIFEGPMELPVKAVWTRSRYPEKQLAYHEEYEYHLIKRGCGSYFIVDRQYEYRKNTLVIIRPNEVHRCIPAPGSYLEKASLFFPASLVENRKPGGSVNDRDFCHVITLAEQEATLMEIIVNSICREIKTKDDGWSDIVTVLLQHFLLLVKRELLHGERVPAGNTNPMASRLMEHIEQRLDQPLALHAIAQDFGCTSGHLSRLFKQHTGLNPKHYIIQRRVAEAKRLLKEDSGLTVDSISQRVGFEDFAVFNRNFKLVTGMTPSMYRKLQLPAVQEPADTGRI